MKILLLSHYFSFSPFFLSIRKLSRGKISWHLFQHHQPHSSDTKTIFYQSFKNNKDKRESIVTISWKLMCSSRCPVLHLGERQQHEGSSSPLFHILDHELDRKELHSCKADESQNTKLVFSHTQSVKQESIKKLIKICNYHHCDVLLLCFFISFLHCCG